MNKCHLAGTTKGFVVLLVSERNLIVESPRRYVRSTEKQLRWQTQNCLPVSNKHSRSLFLRGLLEMHSSFRQEIEI